MTEPLMALREFTAILQSGGPWAAIFFLWWWNVRDQKKWEDKFSAVKRMYENNVKLVEGYARLADDQQSMVIKNIEVLTKLADKIDQNQYCPMVRVEKKKVEVGI